MENYKANKNFEFPESSTITKKQTLSPEVGALPIEYAAKAQNIITIN
jgi:hypothetical protein